MPPRRSGMHNKGYEMLICLVTNKVTCLYAAHRYAALADEVVADELVVQDDEPNQRQFRQLELHVETLVENWESAVAPDSPSLEFWNGIEIQNVSTGKSIRTR